MADNDVQSRILRQMEFYFSEGNLPKDQYLLQQLAMSEDGFVNLDVFLRCNKIRALLDSTALLAKCLDGSRTLELNTDKTGVRRRSPLRSLDPVDDRTIYVEGLPSSVEAESVERHFSGVGKVLFVSLPRYRSSGERKGFGFVEFESVAEARAAVALQSEFGPPLGVFPVANKGQLALRQRAQAMGVDVSDLVEKGSAVGGGGEVATVRAASKRTWLRLRRRHFAKTTAVAKEIQRRMSAFQEKEREKEKEEEVEVAEGSVLRLQPAEALTRAEVRQRLADVDDSLEYVEATGGLVFLRCKSAAHATEVAAACTAHNDLGAPHSLNPAEEQQYRQRVAADLDRKRTKRRAKRGKTIDVSKPLEKATDVSKPLENTTDISKPLEKEQDGEITHHPDEADPELEAMRGSVLLATTAESRKTLRERLEAVAARVAHVDVMDGEGKAHVRCRHEDDVPVVREALETAGVSARVIAGDEETLYLRWVLVSRRAKETRNAKRKWRKAGKEDSNAKVRKCC